MLLDFPISVLIVDDHPLFRKAIRDALRELSVNCKIEEAEHGVACLERLNKNLFDLVLLDINMPVMDGFECLKRIKSKWPTQVVAVLTQYDHPGFLKRMQELGADGYILKDSKINDLRNAVLSIIMENSVVYNQEVNNKLEHIVDKLSKREIEILKMLTDEKRSKEIADQLGITVNTVNNHRRSILRKLGLKDTTGMIKWALKNGFTSALEV